MEYATQKCSTEKLVEAWKDGSLINEEYQRRASWTQAQMQGLIDPLPENPQNSLRKLPAPWGKRRFSELDEGLQKESHLSPNPISPSLSDLTT